VTGRILLLLLLGALTAYSQPTNQSLISRVEAITRWTTDPKTSPWRTSVFEGVVIGGVASTNPDAIMSPDYGTLWSIAALTDQPDLRERQLPSARNFKLKQIDPAPGFFLGAPLGDFFLPADKRFASPRDTLVAPADLAGALQDLGNVLLFNPNDTNLLECLRLGAERLLAWQHADGHWDPAYDRVSQKALPNQPADPRPVFYGLRVAHRILGDPKYLAAAQRGADWFIAHPAANGPAGFNYSGQIAQAFLDLPARTNESTYREAAVEAVNVYGHTNGNQSPVTGFGRLAATLLRVHDLTGNARFLNRARSEILHDKAFATSNLTVTAWSQMGSLLDYLLSEAYVRSGRKIDFPRGFTAAHTGPHQPYGFAPGTILGEPAFLKLPPGLITSENPSLEYLSALGTRDSRLFVIALNNSDRDLVTNIKLNPDHLIPGKTVRWLQGRPLSLQVQPYAGWAVPLDPYGNWKVTLPPYGLAVFQVTFQ
jgi:hypothetical protein